MHMFIYIFMTYPVHKYILHSNYEVLKMFEGKWTLTKPIEDIHIEFLPVLSD